MVFQHVDEIIAVHAAQALMRVQDDDEHRHRKRHHDLGDRVPMPNQSMNSGASATRGRL